MKQRCMPMKPAIDSGFIGPHGERPFFELYEAGISGLISSLTQKDYPELITY
ncbi:protein of unknown function [Xenorhabdus poinarii G6]|uniref:Uncharacterized protein n=1 Tax=Xenorhabdus poinarii G6 TaxID=1354304 RepID=A0A068R313_9GAMM|nr:protein of unknown function [Xenorhabdus poinarii G6]